MHPEVFVGTLAVRGYGNFRDSSSEDSAAPAAPAVPLPVFLDGVGIHSVFCADITKKLYRQQTMVGVKQG
jgi:hypothetical protein